MNIGIVATNGTFLKKIGWINTISGGVYAGMSEKLNSSHITYHADGGYYRTFGEEKASLIKKKIPLKKMKGYEHLFIYEDPTNLLQTGTFTDFPFKKIDEAIYVDMRNFGEYWRFGIGLLKPYAFKNLKEPLQQAFPSIHLITRHDPWIIVGYGPSSRPKVITKN